MARSLGTRLENSKLIRKADIQFASMINIGFALFGTTTMLSEKKLFDSFG
jgi:hypothetical protein